MDVWHETEFMSRWRTETERWFENNKASDEDKYNDLMKSLKKNKVIKDFVVKVLMEKVVTTQTVKRVLEVMVEKYVKTTGEKILETMKKISNLRTESKVDVLINNLEQIVTEMERPNLAENLKYALCL